MWWCTCCCPTKLLHAGPRGCCCCKHAAAVAAFSTRLLLLHACSPDQEAPAYPKGTHHMASHAPNSPCSSLMPAAACILERGDRCRWCSCAALIGPVQGCCSRAPRHGGVKGACCATQGMVHTAVLLLSNTDRPRESLECAGASYLWLLQPTTLCCPPAGLSTVVVVVGGGSEAFSLRAE